MSSAVNQVLADYVAGRTGVGELVRAVRTAHYGAGTRAEPTWQALVETIERAVPGMLELSSTAGTPGFALRPLEDSVSTAHEAQLRAAAQAVLAASPSAGEETPVPTHPLPGPRPPLWRRIVRTVRRLFGGRG